MNEDDDWTNRLRRSSAQNVPKVQRVHKARLFPSPSSPGKTSVASRKLLLYKRVNQLLRFVLSVWIRLHAITATFLRRYPHRAIALCAVLFVIITSLSIMHARATSQTATKSTAKTTSPVRATPSYSTIAPTSKSIDSLGGWYRVNPPGTDPVYAFADQIGSVRIDVSQQPLPSSMKSNTAEAIAQLAQGFGAAEKLKISGVTAYIGTSAKGPQSVIYSTRDLLVLIRSTDKLTTDQWTQYISKLQ